MSSRSCHVTYPTATLLEYWLGELAAPAASAFEEHLFECGECSERMRNLVQLGHGIRRLTREGDLNTVLTAPYIEHLKQTGFRVREYRMEPGGSVACTITSNDDLVVAHLHAPLHGVRRLDLVVDDVTAGVRYRLEDVAFDATADEVVLAPSASGLRRLNVATQRVQLVAVESSGDRALGEYTFNHSAT